MENDTEMQDRDGQIRQLQDQLNSARTEMSKLSQENLNMINQMKSKDTEIGYLKKSLAMFRENKSIIDAELVKANAKIEVLTELNIESRKSNEKLLIDLVKSQEQCKKLEESKGWLDTVCNSISIEKVIGFGLPIAAYFLGPTFDRYRLENHAKAVADAKKFIELDPHHPSAEVARVIIARHEL
ncbi:hypothetical protein M3Y97_01163500 [Aphelenchoides bicaudatus]|nr:hypothetical protein M3Y97_01163500 [Aphelenchoides bicaudatus]